MKQFSNFHPLVLSLYSKDLYRDVGRNWKGLAAAYLLILLALACVPDVVKLHRGLSKAVREDFPGIVQQFPAMTIKNGELETDPPGPHIITDPNTKQLVMIIDPTDQHKSQDAPENVVWMTKRELVINQRGGMQRRVPLSQFGDRTITRANALAFLEGLTKWFPPVWFGCLLIASFVFRLAQALLYAAIGNLFMKSLKVSLDFAALTRLAVIAITPVVYLNLVFEFLVQGMPWFVRWPVCIAVALGYLRFGVKACAEPLVNATAGAVAPSV